MAYNPNTRLLLTFDESPYEKDWSEHARACTINDYASVDVGAGPYSTNGGCLFCDGLNSSGNIGQISVDSPGTLFASTSSVKRIDLWYSADAAQDAGSGGVFNFVLSTGQNLRLYVDSDGALTFLTTGGSVGTFIAASPADAANVFGSGWHHLRVYLTGATVTIGRDGAQVAQKSHSTDIWGSGTLIQAAFGQGQDYWSHLGQLDSIWVLEGDTGWTGGSYAVPTAPPDIHQVGPISVSVSGQVFAHSYGSIVAAHPVSAGVAGQTLVYGLGSFKLRFDPKKGPPTLFGSHYAGRLVGDNLVPKAGQEDVARIANEFWETPAPVSGDLSVGIAGQLCTYETGGLFKEISGPVVVGLTGQTLAYSQGGGGRAVAAGVSGVTAGIAAGGIAPARSAPLAGVSAAPAAGGLTNAARTVTPPGQSITHTQGSLGFSFAPDYDINSLLLVKFNEASGAKTVVDKTPAARVGACLSVAAVTSSQGMFGSNGVAVGNPGGTKDPYAYVDFSHASGEDIYGLFLGADATVAKQVDVWFRPSTNNSHTLFSITLNNGDSVWLRSSMTAIEAQYILSSGAQRAYCSGSKSSNLNTWRHYRLLIDGASMRVGYNGAEVCSTTIGSNIWRGDPLAMPYAIDVTSIRIGRPRPEWDSADYDFLAAQGHFDDFVITAGAVSWSGGAYPVPAYSPADAPLLPPISAVGSNTLDAITGDGAAVLFDIRYAHGSNTVDDCVGAGAAVHDDHQATGANTVDDCIGEGYVAQGVVRLAEGSAVLESTQASGTGVMTPISRGSGVSVTEAIISSGEGGIGWTVGEGAATLESVSATGAGTVAAYLGPIGAGANTASTTSSGAGSVLVSGTGQNTALVASFGTVTDLQYASGENTADVMSSGTAQCATHASGNNTLQSATSFGQIVVSVLGTGASVASVASLGTGELPIAGVGSNSVSVMTVPEYLGDEVFNLVCFERPTRAFIKKTSPSIAVRAA